tara:strand:+ start:887 stop:1363 length:477 start_codon:yes stop_codon:yes gene_type:complete
MELVKNKLKQAQDLFTKADHLIYTTYPIVKENKLLYSSIVYMDRSLMTAISAWVEYERYYKRISPGPKDLNSKFHIFKTYIARKHQVPLEYVKNIMDIRAIIKAYKESPMTFSRKEKFVMWSNEDKLKTINVEQIKKHLTKSRLFLGLVENKINARRK